MQWMNSTVRYNDEELAARIASRSAIVESRIGGVGERGGSDPS
jgi:hypothetical protein